VRILIVSLREFGEFFAIFSVSFGFATMEVVRQQYTEARVERSSQEVVL
jgi:hypothetical protein